MLFTSLSDKYLLFFHYKKRNLPEISGLFFCHRAVSKDVLAKAGLVSCLDYYTDRHALKLC